MKCKNAMLKILVSTLCLLIMSMISVGQTSRIIDVSIIRLIATPEAYDGKPVRVIGYARIVFEGSAVYIHAEDDKRSIAKNGVWLDIGKTGLNKYRSMDGKYVLIEGRFDAKNNGHHDAFSGTIENINRFEIWVH